MQPATLLGYATITDLDDASTADRARVNHTGAQAISTITGLQTALDDRPTDADLVAALATKVTGVGIVQAQAITQAAYDALPTPRPGDVLYVVVG